ncbi:MAG TPA: hypothetical protein VHN18_20325, partial [Micromonosporaceae bacterium]|nr:hypothetical protein [Micromonosporaceae bacterium]
KQKICQKTRANQTPKDPTSTDTKQKFGTGIQSTLLSSQTTTTHHNTTTKAETAGWGHSLPTATPTASGDSRSQGSGRPADRRFAAFRPAPAGLTTLPGRLRNLNPM